VEGSFFRFGIHRLAAQRVDMRQRRHLVAQALEEAIDRRVLALQLHEDAFGIVADESRQTAFMREAMNEGPKSDTLDLPDDPHSFAPNGLRSGRGHGAPLERVQARKTGLVPPEGIV
jgi:hypothetical protein